MTDRVALVVDDAPANREFLERLLSSAKFRIIAAGNGQGALDAVSDLDVLPLAVVDMKLPDMTGLELAQEIRKRFPDTYLVIATMYDERSMMEAAFQHGCNVYLVKPHGFMELFQRLMSRDLESLCAENHTVIDQFGPREFKLK